MSAISDYNSLCQAGQNAINAGMYGVAFRKFEAAMAALLRIPDSELESEKLTFPRKNLENLVSYCRRRAQETGQATREDASIRHVNMEYERG